MKKIIYFLIPILLIPVFYVMAENNQIPEWIKSTAGWWSGGLISDNDFLSGIKYLIENNILIIEQDYVDVKGDLFIMRYYMSDLKNVQTTALHTWMKKGAIFGFDNSRPELYVDIKQDSQQKTIVVFPMFTKSAYKAGGFYDYYNNECDEKCLTTPIINDTKHNYISSSNAILILQLLGYKFITDIDIDKNPEILKQFDKVILLHNEYVTKEMFDAITGHPKVIYLYPNALYAEIETDYSTNTIKLIRGHSYPEKEIDNGFDWEFDNTHPYEFDSDCENWEFYKIENGHMLNCYPEYLIYKDHKLLKMLKDF